MVAAYREPDQKKGRKLMPQLIESVSHGAPGRAGRSDYTRPRAEQARRRRPGLLRPARHLQRPTEAINGRLEHLRGSALGFRNLTNYIARSLLEPAASDPDYTLDCDEPLIPGLSYSVAQ